MTLLPSPRLLFIADAQATTHPLEAIVKEALQAGCRWILYRDLHAPHDALASMAKELAQHCRDYGATLAISRFSNLAKAIGINALHLSSQQSIREARHLLGPDGLIGQSCHTEDEARKAAAEGADYITLSPIFETASKPGYGPALGAETLRKISTLLPIPVLALGGMTPEKVPFVLAAGAKGVAVMGDILRARSPFAQIRAYMDKLR